MRGTACARPAYCCDESTLQHSASKHDPNCICSYSEICGANLTSLLDVDPHIWAFRQVHTYLYMYVVKANTHMYICQPIYGIYGVFPLHQLSELTTTVLESGTNRRCCSGVLHAALLPNVMLSVALTSS